MGSFAQHRHLESKSTDLQSYQLLLKAFDEIDDLLQSYADAEDVQVYRGIGALELRAPVPEEEGALPSTPSTLDYLIRLGEVEVQLEVLLPPANGFLLARDVLQRYSRIMSGNWRTQAVVAVWATEQLDSVLLDIRRIHHHLEPEEDEISIAAEDLSPLSSTLRHALQRHERVFWHEQDIRQRQSTEFDLLGAFRRALMDNWHELQSSAPRKIKPERRIAIESITHEEIESVADLVADAVRGELSSEEIQQEISRMSTSTL